MGKASCSSEAKAAAQTWLDAIGADTAKNIAAHAREIKAAGSKYCDCPACTAVAAILDKKAQLV